MDRYLRLFEEGVLSHDDRVELLEGVIVAMLPRNPPHDSAVSLVNRALIRAVGDRAAVRPQCSLVLGGESVPEPDLAVVEGHERDYSERHPIAALLVIEVADTSLVQDRLTKAAIYAAAGIPEYWIVNLRDGRVEVFRSPDAKAGCYRESRIARRGERLELAVLPDAGVLVEDLLPGPA